MTTLLETILEPGALELKFQPIVELQSKRRSTFGFECLTRGPRDTNARDAAVLFEYVRRKRAECVIDRLCVSNAFENAHVVAPYRISVNVHASTMSTDPAFSRDTIESAKRAGLDPRNVIVEIIEHCGIVNDAQFERSVGALRDGGFRIALDDFGMGHSNFKLILECQPDFFKIDRYFVSALPDDNTRAALVESILDLATRLGARVIAEGVESRLVEGVLHLLGVELLQGYLYAAPLSASDAASFAAESEPRVALGGQCV